MRKLRRNYRLRGDTRAAARDSLCFSRELLTKDHLEVTEERDRAVLTLQVVHLIAGVIADTLAVLEASITFASPGVMPIPSLPLRLVGLQILAAPP